MHEFGVLATLDSIREFDARRVILVQHRPSIVLRCESALHGPAVGAFRLSHLAGVEGLQPIADRVEVRLQDPDRLLFGGGGPWPAHLPLRQVTLKAVF